MEPSTTLPDEKPIINIDNEFAEYLKMVYGANANRLPAHQLLEIKRAFMAGMSTAFVRLVTDTTNPMWNDDDVAKRLKTIEDALHKYWDFEQAQTKQPKPTIIQP